MDVKLYNTLSRTKEDFVPINPPSVGIYSCGPTVYLYAHIGNMRPYVFSDVLRRMFEYNGFNVKQVINITDVGHLVGDGDVGEDKIEQEAQKQNMSAKEITDFYLDAYLKDLTRLNIKTENTIFPRASLHIPEQIELIKKLEEKGFTYKTSDGIYFDTAKDPKYTELANLDLEGLQEGARVEINNEKRHPSDFALWKFSNQKEKRQQEWPSPWGIGFPGWHIECSAMSMKYLGNHFDIHTGGTDHIPVHHTNERAQSECATGETFVNYWLHVSFITVDGEKMSKSLGNIYRLIDLEEKGFSSLHYRYWLLTASYRKTINFTWEALSGAAGAYNRLINSLAEIQNKFGSEGQIVESYQEKFRESISDDLNTPQAIALIWDILREEKINPTDKLATILDFDQVLALNLSEAINKANVEIPDSVKELVAMREQARQDKNYSKSDELREEINQLGYSVDDTETGPKIRQL